MVVYIEEEIKRMIDYDLREAGMSESDFLQRAVEKYYPELRRFVKALRERKG